MAWAGIVISSIKASSTPARTKNHCFETRESVLLVIERRGAKHLCVDPAWQLFRNIIVCRFAKSIESKRTGDFNATHGSFLAYGLEMHQGFRDVERLERFRLSPHIIKQMSARKACKDCRLR